MSKDIRRSIKALESLSAKELRGKYAEVFGEPSRSNNRQWLYRRVAYRLQILAEGDLSERGHSRAYELARDADLRVRPPLGFQMWSSAEGAPTVTKPLNFKKNPRIPAAGTVITRVYQGKTHHVTVLPSGFEYEGHSYKTLTAVAQAITGSHWNGFAFFNLTTHREKVKES